MTRIAALLLVVALAGCADRSVCPIASEQPMTINELFFGRDIPGRPPLTDAEWSDFAVRVIAKEFPDGFTTMDGEGQWRDPATQTLVRERTKILIVAALNSSDLASRISRIRNAYSRLYRQTSVGILTYDACGEF